MLDFKGLPDEMLSEVGAHLPMQANKRFSLVSKRMRTITVSFWLAVCEGARGSADACICVGFASQFVVTLHASFPCCTTPSMLQQWTTTN